MKKILGLDLGTNSIGWAVVNEETVSDDKSQITGIDCAGSRIIPMDAKQKGEFDKGNTVSQTADRTAARGARRLRERYLMRRERLHRVLHLMGYLPQHYDDQLTRYGQFKDHQEPKLAWRQSEAGMEFLFRSSFDEMLKEFHQHHPDLKIPYDWTLYYLRQKALTEALSREELAWLLLNFNQKRGYNQARGEEDDDDKKELKEYVVATVLQVKDTGEKKGKQTWYDVLLEGGLVYHYPSVEAPDWVGKQKEFIVTTKLDDAGQPLKDKEGQIRRSFKMPEEGDWTLVKKRTESLIGQSGLTVGQYIYQALLKDPSVKVIGGLVRTIDRKYYKQELTRILDVQKQYHPELTDPQMLERLAEELYQSNLTHRSEVMRHDVSHLILEDILFYQRPLKSKKSLISTCPYEFTEYADPKTGEIKEAPLKCIAKSHPLYQEFRLWQFVQNLRIIQTEGYIEEIQKADQPSLFGDQVVVKRKVLRDEDVTALFLPDNDARAQLYDWLNTREKITQDTLLGTYFKCKKPKGKDTSYPYRWNYVTDKEYPCNETRGSMVRYMKKCTLPESLLTPEAEAALWHILYSVSDRQQLHTALLHFAQRYQWGDADTFADTFVKYPPFKADYGAYSAKAIKKMLPLMRMGSHWRADAIDPQTQERLQHMIDGEIDEKIATRVREKALHLTTLDTCQGLPLWLVCYIIYNRHSEASDTQRWTEPKDIDRYLYKFRQHSMRNPIVEKVVTETLRTVRDIWKQVGRIDEIHIELGREMKNPADKRKQLSQQIQKNENTNQRIKALLREFMNPEFDIAGVRPYSPSQQDLLRIYEDGVLSDASQPIPDDIADILKKYNQPNTEKFPTRSEVLRYKCWLEQRYRSPYTGEVIPLSRLFTTDYEIEHVIPQSRYFDDSFGNKVICESEVNKLKDNLLGYEFIKKHHGRTLTLTGGKVVKIFEPDAYTAFVDEHYKQNNQKREKLLMDDIPDKFIERQMNDSRYISRFIMMLLSNIVREENETEATSKHVIPCNGTITTRLKEDWGVNDQWNRLILPRFLRLNELQDTQAFTATSAQGHLIPAMPFELQRGFNKKRIDHRHHAMDAIVIACASRNIVNYLNNESARKGAAVSRQDLRHLLCVRRPDGNYAKEIQKPWPTFSQDVYTTLSGIVVSFKQNLRILTKTNNTVTKYVDGKKQHVRQTQSRTLAIRASLHKDTVFGEVNLRRQKTVNLKEALKMPSRIVDKDLKKKLMAMQELGFKEKQITQYFLDNQDIWKDVDLKKIAVYYFTKETNDRFFATRKPVDETFTEKFIREKVTDTGAQKILLAHLAACNGDPAEAFSPDGLDRMNATLQQLNDGKSHQPIKKVRVYEKAQKYAIGQTGNKTTKFVEAADGTNLFFAIYEYQELDKKTGDVVTTRDFASIPLYEAIDRRKKGLSVAPVHENGTEAKYILSPGDLVYVPTPEQRSNGIQALDRNRIYKMVSCTDVTCYFVPYASAQPIVNKVEYESLNKIGKAITGEMIKTICVPLKTDRLGNITEIQL